MSLCKSLLLEESMANSAFLRFFGTVKAQAVRARVTYVSRLLAAHTVWQHNQITRWWQLEIWPQILTCQEATLHQKWKYVRLIRYATVQAIRQIGSLLQQVRVFSFSELGLDRSCALRIVLPAQLKVLRLISSICVWCTVHDEAVEANAQFLASKDTIYERIEVLWIILSHLEDDYAAAVSRTRAKLIAILHLCSRRLECCRALSCIIIATTNWQSSAYIIDPLLSIADSLHYCLR